MRNNITFGGNKVTLLGEEVVVGQKAPNFTATKQDFSPFNFSELEGKNVVISVVPSIDTGVCEFQTIKFNEDISKFDDTVVVTISVDLPPAIGRFCAVKGIDNSIVLSDYKEREFGLKYGFLIDEFKLLSRGVVIVGKDGLVKYVEYVQEVSTHPDYDRVLQFLKTI